MKPVLLNKIEENIESKTSNLNSNISQINSALNNKANDNDVVKLTGNQTIAGTKTFSSIIDSSIDGNAGTAHKATQDSDGNKISTTYGKASDVSTIQNKVEWYENNGQLGQMIPLQDVSLNTLLEPGNYAIRQNKLMSANDGGLPFDNTNWVFLNVYRYANNIVQVARTYSGDSSYQRSTIDFGET